MAYWYILMEFRRPGSFTSCWIADKFEWLFGDVWRTYSEHLLPEKEETNTSDNFRTLRPKWALLICSQLSSPEGQKSSQECIDIRDLLPYRRLEELRQVRPDAAEERAESCVFHIWAGVRGKLIISLTKLRTFRNWFPIVGCITTRDTWFGLHSVPARRDLASL